MIWWTALLWRVIHNPFKCWFEHVESKCGHVYMALLGRLYVNNCLLIVIIITWCLEVGVFITSFATSSMTSDMYHWARDEHVHLDEYKPLTSLDIRIGHILCEHGT